MPFGGYSNRIVVTKLSEMSEAIEASDFRGRIRLKQDSGVNNKAVRRIAAIMNGEVRPSKSLLAGNDYFGHVRFEYERPDLNQTEPKSFFLSVKVFSALGSTLEEHDARYRKNKELRFGAISASFNGKAGQVSRTEQIP